MEATKRAIELIKLYEGYSPQAYMCPAGEWTIGYGHTRDVTSESRTTREEAEKMLIEDVLQSQRYVNAMKLTLRESQFDALVSFVFNVGIGNFQSSTLHQMIRSNPDNPSIYKEFCRWSYVNKKLNAGLLNRRKNEAKLYFLDSKEDF